jgi:hypothetical protein
MLEPSVNEEIVHMVIDENSIATMDPFSLIEPAWAEVDIEGSVEDYERSLARFSEPQRLFTAIAWYRTEVNNGGHDQFFYNSAGIVWPDALAGFRAVGALDAARILEEAVKRAGGASRTRAERQEHLDRHEPNFDDLDDAFYEIEGVVEDAMLEYARANPAPFYFSGHVRRTDL